MQSAVDVYGHLFSFFSVPRSPSRLSPLPLLYVLVAEVLACNIIANPRIIGVTLPCCTTPLPVVSQYADNTSLVVTTDDSINASFETYSLFEKGSGAKLNLSKSKGLWLGSWVGRAHSPVALDWSPFKLKILGVFWVWVTLRGRIGALGLTLFTTFYSPGVSESCPFKGDLWSLMRLLLPRLVCGVSNSHDSLGSKGAQFSGVYLFLKGKV